MMFFLSRGLGGFLAIVGLIALVIAGGQADINDLAAKAKPTPVARIVSGEVTTGNYLILSNFKMTDVKVLTNSNTNKVGSYCCTLTPDPPIAGSSKGVPFRSGMERTDAELKEFENSGQVVASLRSEEGQPLTAYEQMKADVGTFNSELAIGIGCLVVALACFFVPARGGTLVVARAGARTAVAGYMMSLSPRRRGGVYLVFALIGLCFTLLGPILWAKQNPAAGIVVSAKFASLNLMILEYGMFVLLTGVELRKVQGSRYRAIALCAFLVIVLGSVFWFHSWLAGEAVHFGIKVH